MILKLMFAFASLGMTLRASLPQSMVGAKVLRTSAFVMGATFVKTNLSNGPNTSRLVRTNLNGPLQ